MSGTTLRRKEREKLLHRNEILTAAQAVLARDGYAGATVERIAQEADFAVGTLYNFFQSKAQLFEEVLAKTGDEFIALFEREVQAETDPTRALHILIELRLRFPQERRELARVFINALLDADNGLPRAFPPGWRELRRRYLGFVAGVIRRGIAAGQFRPDDPMHLALCLEGSLAAVGAHWIEEEPAQPLADRMEEVQRIVTRMVCNHTPDSRSGENE